MTGGSVPISISGSRRAPSIAAAVLAASLAAAPAAAQGAPTGAGNLPDLGGTPQSSGQPAAQGTEGQGNSSIASSLGRFGDPGGVRAALEKRGVTYSFVFIGEVLGNATGGVRRGSIAEGRLDLQLNVDLGKAMGLDGVTLHANGYEILGQGLSRRNLDNLSPASNIEALPSTRLYEAWVEQVLLDGKVGIKAGQIGADTEFFVSQYATLFVNSTFGWPNITSYDLPSGGPAYPLATPGLRLRLSPTAKWTLLAGVFDGDPSGTARSGGDADPQALDPTGTNFRVTDPPLGLAETALTTGDKDGPLLPGTVKVGGWEHFGRFARDIPTAGGLTLGAGTGRLRGNDGIYGIADQTLYRVPGTEDASVSIFARLSGSPGDRNLVSFYADAGVTEQGLVPGRADDTAGLSFAYTQVSPAARRTDREERAELGLPYPVRSNEVLFEATYQAQVVPGFTIQPDVQYVIRPGGRIPDPSGEGVRPIRDEAVFGLRATVQY